MTLNNNDQPSQVPAQHDRPLPSIPHEPLTQPPNDSQRQAAADVTRGQIDQIYAQDSSYTPFESKTEVEAYAHQPASQVDHFKKYHSAWQDYYQKYYEGYYTQAVRHTAEQLRLRAEMERQSSPAAVFSGERVQTSHHIEPPTDTPHSAVRKLQSQFKEKVRSRAGKVRKSRHFWPLMTAAIVAIVFLFLQYNRLLIANVAAYVSPGSVDPQNIIVDPTTDTKVGPDPKLIIPKINVDAPVDYSVTTFDNNQIEKHLKNGVVKYAIPGANALPGQVGNLVIGGHSSNDVFDDGGYKFVFVQLEHLAIGDTFYINYNSTRYTYHVTKLQTIEPNQISVLTQSVSAPTVTLITCTPVGTALHRFLVIGEQVSPDPAAAARSTDSRAQPTATVIPGNSPTLLQRILGQ